MAVGIVALFALAQTALGEVGGPQSAVALDGGAQPLGIGDGSTAFLRAGTPDRGPPLSRKKRYVSFPTGSVFSIIICLAKRTLIRYPDFYTFNFDLDVGYKLPNSTQFFIARRRRDGGTSEERGGPYDDEEEASTIMHRRDRRALYYQVEEFLQALGLSGRECVLRTICEARQVLPLGSNLMEDVFRVIFTMPPLRHGMTEEFTGADGNGFPVDPTDEAASAKEYDAANAFGVSEVDCSNVFPCTVSLLEVALW